MISTIITSIIGLWLLILSIRVIALRGVSFLRFFSFNNFNDKTLNRAIRAQGNLVEYAPVFLILIFIAEYNGAHPHMLYMTGTLFIIARLMHGFAFGFMKNSPFLRMGGTILTFLCILIISISNIISIL